MSNLHLASVTDFGGISDDIVDAVLAAQRGDGTSLSLRNAAAAIRELGQGINADDLALWVLADDIAEYLPDIRTAVLDASNSELLILKTLLIGKDAMLDCGDLGMNRASILDFKHDVDENDDPAAITMGFVKRNFVSCAYSSSSNANIRYHSSTAYARLSQIAEDVRDNFPCKIIKVKKKYIDCHSAYRTVDDLNNSGLEERSLELWLPAACEFASCEVYVDGSRYAAFESDKPWSDRVVIVGTWTRTRALASSPNCRMYAISSSRLAAANNQNSSYNLGACLCF